MNLMDRIRPLLRQLVSYFFVGLSAALVEWSGFWTFNSLLHMNIYISTILAFLIATFVNWILGRKTTFKNHEKSHHVGKDLLPVFLVSGVGLGLNITLMWLFVGIWLWVPLLSKIMSTGIVFAWNFTSRRLLIYRNLGGAGHG